MRPSGPKSLRNNGGGLGLKSDYSSSVLGIALKRSEYTIEKVLVGKVKNDTNR